MSFASSETAELSTSALYCSFAPSACATSLAMFVSKMLSALFLVVPHTRSRSTPNLVTKPPVANACRMCS